MGYLLGNCWRGGFVQPDVTRDALALVSAGEWTANVVQSGGTYLDAVPVQPGDANYSDYYGYPPGTTVPDVSPPDMAYGSPCWDADSDKLWFVGLGGHANGVQNGIYNFDPKICRVVQTQVSGRVSQTEDTGARFQSTDNLGWRSWPRDPAQTADRSANLGAGNRGPISCHGYGGTCKSGPGELFHMGSAAFFGGNGQPGGAQFVDTAIGQWKQGANDAWPTASGALPAAPDCFSFYMPDSGSANAVIWRVASPNGTPDAYVLRRNLTSYHAHRKFSVAPEKHCGAVIPDPDNPGFRAYLALLDNGDRTRLCIANKIDADDDTVRDFAQTAVLPANIPANITGSSTWIWMGGSSRKVAIFAPVNGGTQLELWSLDLDTMTFTQEVSATGSPNPQINSDTIGGTLWKKVWFDASRGAFGLITGTTAALCGDSIYYLKRPAGL